MPEGIWLITNFLRDLKCRYRRGKFNNTLKRMGSEST